MTSSAVRQLVRRVLATQDFEPDFDAAQAALAPLADAMARGEDVSERLAWLAPHLAQSPETGTTLDALAFLARRELEGSLPATGALWAELRRHTRPDGAEAAAPETASRAVGRERGRGQPGGRTRRGWPRLTAELARAALVGRRPGSGGWVPAARWAWAALPAVGVLAVTLALGGKWRADRRATDTAAPVSALVEAPGSELAAAGGVTDARSAEAQPVARDDYAALAATVSSASEVRFERAADGAWARVVYAPDHRRALVWSGDLPQTVGRERLRCWLESPDGLRHAPRVLDQRGADNLWWYLEAERDWGEYEAFGMSVEPRGRTVVRVGLNR